MQKINKQPIILLIDGNALIHRAFHGMPVLKTKKGQLINAVYGFTSAILSSIQKFDPKYIAVAWDVGKKTFRTEKYPEYKATRVKAPQELYDQFPLTKEVCKALNIPQFGIKNYEADDVIGTIASQISECRMQNAECKNLKSQTSNLKSIIVTGDMDALQLVNDSTQVYSVSRGIKKAVLYDKNKVKEKYGFEPEQLIDYKALRGDPSDNIPGVRGVGEKTAVNLIKIFSNQISKRIKQLLLKYKKQAYLSRELATVCKEAPLDFRLSEAKVTDYDPKKVEELFRKLEFKSLLKRLPKYKPIHEQKKLF